MYESLLRRAGDLKRRSRSLRDQGDAAMAAERLDDAVQHFTEGEKLLEQARQALAGEVEPLEQTLPPGLPAASDVTDLATELSDCLGSLGGMRRRHADALRRLGRSAEADAMFERARDAYERGRSLEADDRFRIANSYNLVQSAVVPVLTASARLADLGGTLQDIAFAIERQIVTTRSNDPWAYSDLGLVYLLSGDEARAQRNWDRMDALQPQRKVYASGLPVLESLAGALPEIAPALQRATDRFRQHAGPSRGSA